MSGSGKIKCKGKQSTGQHLIAYAYENLQLTIFRSVYLIVCECVHAYVDVTKCIRLTLTTCELRVCDRVSGIYLNREKQIDKLKYGRLEIFYAHHQILCGIFADIYPTLFGCFFLDILPHIEMTIYLSAFAYAAHVRCEYEH